MKPQGEREREEERSREKLQKLLENNEQNYNKYITINNYFKCKWTEFSNKEIQSDCMDQRQKPQDSTTSFLQETHFRSKHTQTESEGMEKDIPCKRKQEGSSHSCTHIRKNRL